jgi:hypothetical protein
MFNKNWLNEHPSDKTLQWFDEHPRLRSVVTLPLIFVFLCFHTVLCTLDRMDIIDYEYADARDRKRK